MVEFNKSNPFAYSFNEGCYGEVNFVSQAEQRNAQWVDDAKGHDEEYVANGQETFFGKEAPTTQLFNICAIECPEDCCGQCCSGENSESDEGENSNNG